MSSTPPVFSVFFFWSLRCLFFFELQILITPLVSLNPSFTEIDRRVIIKWRVWECNLSWVSVDGKTDYNVNRDFWSISEKNFELTKEVIRIRESNLKSTDNAIPSRTRTKRHNNALKTDGRKWGVKLNCRIGNLSHSLYGMSYSHCWRPYCDCEI